MAQHPQARAWVLRGLRMLGRRPRLVVEVGARLLHPHDPHDPRPDVNAERFVGVDCNAGDGVDVVALGHEYVPPGPVDIALSLQALEHDPHWQLTVGAMCGWLSVGGVIAVTCAGDGCRPHEHEHSPEPGHYRNVSSREIAAVLRGRGMADIMIDDARTQSMGVQGGWVRSRVLARRPTFEHAWAAVGRIESAVTEREAAMIWAHAARRPSMVVEVGSWKGKLAAALSYAVAPAGVQMVTVDPFDGSTGVGGGVFAPHVMRELQRNLRASAVPGVVEYVHDRSGALGSRWGAESRPPVSMLWVDGDHSTEGVHLDLDAWLPNMADDSVIVLHDVDMAGPRSGFDRLTRCGWRVIDAERRVRVVARR